MGIISRCLHPVRFQGQLQRAPYFEGWYYKFIDASTQNRLSVIPSIAVDRHKQKQHAYIQILSGLKAQSHWLSYPLSEFHYQKDPFCLSIADNFFSLNAVHLNIQQPHLSLQGDILLNNLHPPQNTWTIPSVMGPFAALPLECYHDIISMSHSLQGKLSYNDHTICWDNGRGYLEKDHGHSFPEAWLWLQGNHFTATNASLSLSIARVPLASYSFTGFIAVLSLPKCEYRFATYNNARLQDLSIKKQQVAIVLKRSPYTLKINAIYPAGSTLLAPHQGLMERKIQENLNSTIAVQLTHKRKGLLFADTCHATALELCAGNKL